MQIFYKPKIMKKLSCFTLIFILFLLSGCFTGTIPFTGTYNKEKRIEIISKYSADKVWDKLIDFSSAEGFSVRILDKTAGLMVIDKIGVKITFENDKGQLMDSTALFVLQKEFSGGVWNIPSDPSGEWNIRVKQNDNGTVLITVDLIYLKNQHIYSTKYDKYINENVTPAIATPALEKMIEKYLQ